MEKKLVASVTKYDGDRDKAIQWLAHLPVKYDLSTLDNLEPGEVLMWTNETGFNKSYRKKGT